MLSTTALYAASIKIIAQHQHQSGAYVACPTYGPYQYSWLRDGSFIAYAMDRAGAWESAEHFHRWVAQTVTRYEQKIDDLTTRGRAGEGIAPGEHMHTRFTMEGEEVNDASWGNFQLDGYGLWLWSLTEHIRMTNNRELYEELRPSIERVVRYLETFWQTPCFDCWEEYGDQVHLFTLSALFGGLSAVASFDATMQGTQIVADSIRTYVLEHCVKDGHLTKSTTNAAIDASLLGACVPLGLLAPADVRMKQTIDLIESELGTLGVHRYQNDSYYGGGAWPLLSAWLGWYHATMGSVERAREIRDWIVAQQTSEGLLPEQVSSELCTPLAYEQWVAQSGPSASPLLWSHAMYIILERAIADADGQSK